jgi:hypothetical protein
MKRCMIAVALALGAVHPASAAVTTCSTDLALRGADAVTAIRATCAPGDVVTFRRGASTCNGARCTADDSVDLLCDRRAPIISGNYSLVSCTLRSLPKR